MNAKVCIVEDDKKISELLERYLKEHGYLPKAFLNPQTALDYLRKNKSYDIIVLDVMMPEMDGFNFLRELRHFSQVPVLMLTARGEVSDRIVGLELGADDYMPKPFEPRELLARLNAILRRKSDASSPAKEETIKTKKLNIDKNLREVQWQGKNIDLTPMEYNILLLLVENSHRVLTRDNITELLRGEEFSPYNRSIDVIIHRLREKLDSETIVTVRGAGYRFQEQKE